MKQYTRVHANIDLDAIDYNMRSMAHNVAPGTKLCGIIKADGYGHGAVAIAKTIDPLVWGYGVATMEEGVILRRHGIGKPILVLGSVNPVCYEEMVTYDIRPAIFQYDRAKRLSEIACRLGKDALIHIKIDTGMNRIGMAPSEESIAEILRMAQLPHIVIEGIFTHMATADETDKTRALAQVEQFRSVCDGVKAAGIPVQVCHCSNSAGIVDLPQANMDMVRCGISLYGMYPSDEVQKERVPLRPVMSLYSEVSYIKTIPAGAEVGYGGTFTAPKEMRLATIPVGYGDGYPRNLSNRGYVLIRGQKAPICGRVCMDQFMVDVTEIHDVQEGDLVTLVGTEGTEQITVEELAELAGTFHYEFVCDVGKRIPRVFYRNGQGVGVQDYFTDPVVLYE